MHPALQRLPYPVSALQIINVCMQLPASQGAAGQGSRAKLKAGIRFSRVRRHSVKRSAVCTVRAAATKGKGLGHALPAEEHADSRAPGPLSS